MNSYTIYLGVKPLAQVVGTEYAYEVYKKTCELADLLGKEVCLVWNGTGEVVADYNPEEK